MAADTAARSRSRSIGRARKSRHARSHRTTRDRSSSRHRSPCRGRSRSRSASPRNRRRARHAPSRRHSRGGGSRSRSRSRSSSSSRSRSRSRGRSARSRPSRRDDDHRRHRHGDHRDRGRRSARSRRRRASDAKSDSDGQRASSGGAAVSERVADAGSSTKTDQDADGDVRMIDATSIQEDEAAQEPIAGAGIDADKTQTQNEAASADVSDLSHDETSQESIETTKPGSMSDAPSASNQNEQAAPIVNVSSIKQDILKALAEARSAIAGIKGDAGRNIPRTAMVDKAAAPTSGTTEDTQNNPISAEDAADTRATKEEVVSTTHPPPVTASNTGDDEFDMFSTDIQDADADVPAPPSLVVETTVASNADDADGYYKPRVGEVLNGKYRVLGVVGKGVFSSVLKCQCIDEASAQASSLVAIKMIRNNEVMREAAETEIRILNELSGKDPRDKKHCVRLLDHFEHRHHIALVFESMQMNLREAMKKFGGKGGISIQAVRVFCKHLLIALNHLSACNIVHADIKPDNVLLDEKQTLIKLCDFGSAFQLDQGKHDPTPYLVSRFYRAPEIVLGLAYDKAVDMWSVGCCLYEMFTGQVLFPGATNNEMLRLFMELKGKVPNKIIKKHRQAFIEQFLMEPHFTEDNKFCSRELDRVTGKPVLHLRDAIKPKLDLGAALLSAKSSTDDRKQVLELRNLLDRMFMLDPAKRITPKEALTHAFVRQDTTTR